MSTYYLVRMGPPHLVQPIMSVNLFIIFFFYLFFYSSMLDIIIKPMRYDHV